MAWTTPATATAGSTALTAAFWNEQVRDNMLELAPLFTGWTSYTPTVTASSGTFTTVSCSSRYLRVGKLLLWTGAVTITNAGTASGNIHVPLPVTPFSDRGIGVSQEQQATGIVGCADLQKSNNRIVLAEYDATTFIASGRTVQFTIAYETT